MSATQQTDSTHEHITVATARANFTEITNRVAYGHERLIVDRHHKPLVAMVSLDDLELLEMLEDQQDIAIARQSLKEAKMYGTKSLTDIKKEINKK